LFLLENNKKMKKRVLVSGGAGFIGSHVTVELIQAGYDVVVADNMSNCDMTCFEGVQKITGRHDIPFEKIDFCDLQAVNNLFSEFRIDAVIHFAAFKAVGESVAEPIKYYSNNLGSFLNVLEAAKTHGGCNVLFSSSATVYGEPEKSPVTELSPRQPATSPYGNTKQICEDILRDTIKATAANGTINPGVAKAGAIKGIALRYFNPIGAHPSALIGELPRGVPNNLVPFITQTAIGKRECLSIFGNDYPTPDGTCLRDYIDIVDLAKAHVFAVGRMLDGKMKEDYEIFNIGTGRPSSVLELVKTFEKVNNLKLNYKFAPRRAGDVIAIWCDPSLAEKEMGWKAQRTMEETLQSAWAWEKHLAENK
jgi:UDP-glucose 4-epimerase